MVRLADPDALRAHVARFDPGRLARESLSTLDGRRLDVLLEKPYEELNARDVAQALDLAERSGYEPSLFAYFLPAALRTPPERDVVATGRFLGALLACRGDEAVAAWEEEVEGALAGWLVTRPLRGGDDPVDLWLSERAARWVEIDGARTMARVPRVRIGPGTGWTQASQGPPYARIALTLLRLWPAKAVDRYLGWERSARDDDLRAWVEVTFHAHGEGWRPDPAPLVDVLCDPDRVARARTLLLHDAADLAIGAAAILALLDPARMPTVRPLALARLRDLDARADDRFVVTRAVRRLLTGE
jgi:hypothetical protein